MGVFWVQNWGLWGLDTQFLFHGSTQLTHWANAEPWGWGRTVGSVACMPAPVPCSLSLGGPLHVCACPWAMPCHCAQCACLVEPQPQTTPTDTGSTLALQLRRPPGVAVAHFKMTPSDLHECRRGAQLQRSVGWHWKAGAETARAAAVELEWTELQGWTWEANCQIEWPCRPLAATGPSFFKKQNLK